MVLFLMNKVRIFFVLSFPLLPRTIIMMSMFATAKIQIHVGSHHQVVSDLKSLPWRASIQQVIVKVACKYDTNVIEDFSRLVNCNDDRDTFCLKYSTDTLRVTSTEEHQFDSIVYVS
jgi:hypothetical protein